MVHTFWFTFLSSSHLSREPVNHGSHSSPAPKDLCVKSEKMIKYAAMIKIILENRKK